MESSKCILDKCKFTPIDNGYCMRHQTNYLYDKGIEEGKKWCRFFFRGCRNELDDLTKKSCSSCLAKKFEGYTLCKHNECPRHVKDTKYCGKHERDIYRDRETEENIKFCDIERGCFNICKDGYKTCEQCLTSNRIYEKQLYNKTKNITSELLKDTTSDICICIMCNKTYTKFKTVFNKESTRCPSCNEKQQLADSKRCDRIRNYKEEHYRNKESLYKEYLKSAIRRSLEFLITYEQFVQLISSKCYYCNYIKDDEVNGIDRINNNIAYLFDNCVPCCEVCNMMKSDLDVDYFIEKCKLIASGKCGTPEFFAKWKQYYNTNSKKTNYSYYKRVSEEKRGIIFKLTESEFNTLIMDKCYLCGFSRPSGIGIDRIDSEKEYIIDNSKPCCGSCNIMKNKYQLDTIRETCSKISQIHKVFTYPKFVKSEQNISIKQPIVKIEENEDVKNEIIQPQPQPQKEEKSTPKQWKIKQIYEYIHANNAEPYKTWCASANNLSGEDWNKQFETFRLKVLTFRTQEEAEETIRDFVLGLRKKRHDVLVQERNDTINPIEREDRQQWPSATILKAYHANKIDTFKEWLDTQDNNATDAAAIKRWSTFTKSLQDATSDEDRQHIISKFLTARRTRLYRAQQHKPESISTK